MSSPEPILPAFPPSPDQITATKNPTSTNNSKPVILQRVVSSNSLQQQQRQQKEYPQDEDIKTTSVVPQDHNGHEHRPKKELGKVMRLRDSYGFLHSFNRGEEIFFHFSEIRSTANGNVSLTVGDEVEYEFGYGSGGKNELKKAAAFKVKVANVNGYKMRRQGRVEKVMKGSSSYGGGNNSNGVIRLESEGLSVKYGMNDVREEGCVLGRGDIVELTLGTTNGGKKLLGRDIIVIESREEKMLEESTVEQGVIVSLKDEYGFIRSTTRREHMYFHFSHLTSDTLQKNVRVGKCVEFRVVKEELESGSSSPAARLVQLLPDGSVEFRTVIQKACRGYILSAPYSEISRGKRKKSLENHHPGIVSLSTPIVVDGEEEVIPTVLFHVENSPVSPVWMREGDLIQFDLSKEHLDGSYCVHSPVSLLQASQLGRAEGIVTTLKEGFGFISLAERQADVYFRLTDNVLPISVQKSMLQLDKAVDITVGTEVSFDLSMARQLSGNSNHQRGGNHYNNSEKENLKAHRILPLPKGSTITQKTPAVAVKGIITQLHKDGVGTIELDEPIQGMSLEEHHPLIAKMLDAFLADTATSKTDDSIIYPDVQSTHESRAIIAMAESKGLLVSLLSDTTTDENNTSLRLKISKQLPSPSSSDNEATTASPEKHQKKKIKPLQSVKFIRFDKQHALYSNDTSTYPSVGDVITCDVIHYRRTQIYSAVNLSLTQRTKQLPTPVKVKNSKQPPNCIGLILMEPSHTNLSTPRSRSSSFSSPSTKGVSSSCTKGTSSASTNTTAGRWDRVNIDNSSHAPSTNLTSTNTMNDGFILLLEDSSSSTTHSPNTKSTNTITTEEKENPTSNDKNSILLQHLVYRNENHNHSSRHDHPKRGEFVSFSYIKGGKVKDIKPLRNYHDKSSISKVVGILNHVDKEHQTAVFQDQKNASPSLDDKDDLPSYPTISTKEILGCDFTSLSPTTLVEGILYQSNIYGVCRHSDLYLVSKSKISSSNNKQRPRLNLSVRKELGGKVVAQSSMAKGPIGSTIGFVKGWTTRCSDFDIDAATTTTDGSME